ncbi:MAG: metallophosphoesterase [Geminicoccaceae bacterium]
MRLVVVSDIHDHVWNLRAALHWLTAGGEEARADGVICCGDYCSQFVPRLIARAFADRPVPVVLVWGNNDGDTSRIAMTAQHRPFVRVHDELAELIVIGDRLLSRAELEQQGGDYCDRSTGRRVAVNHFDAIGSALAACGSYDLVCFGHNHRLEQGLSDRTFALNPGALMGWSPLAAGEVKDIPATFAIVDSEAEDWRCRFYEVTQPWRSPGEPGQVSPLELR